MSDPWVRKEVIGDCVLYQGDCLEVMRGIGQVNHVISDPPYEDVLHAAVGKFKKLRNDGKSYASNKIQTFGFGGIDGTRAEVSNAMVSASKGWVIAFCLAEGVRAWRDALQTAGLKYDTCLAWVKPDCAPRFNGQGAARGFECAVTGWAGTGSRGWNGGGKRGVYVFNVNPPDRHGAHATEKPWRLFHAILSDFTNPGETILDPFMGSGTTLVACAKLGRKGIGIELDPSYFDIACERVQKAYDQPDLFVPAPKPAIQEGFDI